MLYLSLSVLAVAYVIFVFLFPESITNIYFRMLEYVIAFFFADKIINYVKTNKIHLVIFAIIFVICCLLKTASALFIDNALLYVNYISPILKSIIGISIFSMVCGFVIHNYSFFLKFKKLVEFYDNISYEFYIVHRTFLVGELAIVSIVNPSIDIIIVFGLSTIAAYVINYLSRKLYEVKKCKKEH